MFFKIFYTPGFTLFLGLARIFSLFSSNLQKQFQIRKYKPNFTKFEPGKYFWFHAASVGEYEQARALAVEMKKKWPDVPQLLTVYSYSGWSQRKHDTFPDHFSVLPFDLPWNWSILAKHPPSAIFYARYDIWFNLARSLNKLHCPQYVICAAINENKDGSVGIPSSKKQIHRLLTRIFTVNERNCKNFEIALHSNSRRKKNTPSIHTAGDTRLEGIIARQKSASKEQITHIANFQKIAANMSRLTSPILIAGSTYSKSESALLAAKKLWPHFRLILAPHQLNETHLRDIEKMASARGLSIERYSKLTESHPPEKPGPFDVLLLDKMGLLLYLYPHCDMAFIGGAFEKKVHNVLEAAVSGLPVICGPRFRNSPEAIDLHQAGALSSLPEWQDSEKTASELITVLKTLDNSRRNEIRNKLKLWTNERTGASQKIIQIIQQDLNL